MATINDNTLGLDRKFVDMVNRKDIKQSQYCICERGASRIAGTRYCLGCGRYSRNLNHLKRFKFGK